MSGAETETGAADCTLATAPSAGNVLHLDRYDKEQIRLMHEVCIVVDNDDAPIGNASKKTCMILSLC
jgi:isopentenyl-diphosphate delta-isomerase